VDKARLDEAQPGGFELLKTLIDVGDIVGASGSIKRTEKGELSVVANNLQARVVLLHRWSLIPHRCSCRRRRRAGAAQEREREGMNEEARPPLTTSRPAPPPLSPAALIT
jgi:hypothetical protein